MLEHDKHQDPLLCCEVADQACYFRSHSEMTASRRPEVAVEPSRDVVCY